MQPGFVIGVDFGTDSARALVMDLTKGETCGMAESGYPRWLAGAYQDPAAHRFRHHPADYLEAFVDCVNRALAEAGPGVWELVRGLAVDATGSTPAPVNGEGTPLALLPEFWENPNAMFCLWKDHTAVGEAREINRALSAWEGQDYTRYQGTYASEWYWAKILHARRTAPAVAAAAPGWVELCDWIPALLTGRIAPEATARCACAAGHKALWHSAWGGLPDRRCLASLDPYLGIVHDHYGGPPILAGEPVGRLRSDWARTLGLPEGIRIAAGSLDAHAGAVGAGIRPDTMVVNIGTSTVNLLVSEAAALAGKDLRSVCGQAEDSILPGLVGIETSQAAFGDLFAWLRDLMLWPVEVILMDSDCVDPATRATIHRELREGLLPHLAEAAADSPLAATPMALDWFNGRRYPRINESLQGAISGLSLGTTAPDLYQALALGAVFGQKRILDSLQAAGLRIDLVIAVGGIPHKAPKIMQLLADVLDIPIRVSETVQAAARGAAIYAAVGVGAAPSFAAAQARYCEGIRRTYAPDPARGPLLDRAYRAYLALGAFMEEGQGGFSL